MGGCASKNKQSKEEAYRPANAPTGQPDFDAIVPEHKQGVESKPHLPKLNGTLGDEKRQNAFRNSLVGPGGVFLPNQPHIKEETDPTIPFIDASEDELEDEPTPSRSLKSVQASVEAAIQPITVAAVEAHKPPDIPKESEVPDPVKDVRIPDVPAVCVETEASLPKQEVDMDIGNMSVSEVVKSVEAEVNIPKDEEVPIMPEVVKSVEADARITNDGKVPVVAEVVKSVEADARITNDGEVPVVAEVVKSVETDARITNDGEVPIVAEVVKSVEAEVRIPDDEDVPIVAEVVKSVEAEYKRQSFEIKDVANPVQETENPFTDDLENSELNGTGDSFVDEVLRDIAPRISPGIMDKDDLNPFASSNGATEEVDQDKQSSSEGFFEKAKLGIESEVGDVKKEANSLFADVSEGVSNGFKFEEMSDFYEKARAILESDENDAENEENAIGGESMVVNDTNVSDTVEDSNLDEVIDDVRELKDKIDISGDGELLHEVKTGLVNGFADASENVNEDIDAAMQDAEVNFMAPILRKSSEEDLDKFQDAAARKVMSSVNARAARAPTYNSRAARDAGISKLGSTNSYATSNGSPVKPKDFLGFQVTDDDDTDCVATQEQILSTSKSVGHIYSPYVQGVGFRVGDRYIMTAYHLIRDMLDKMTAQGISSPEMTILDNKDIWIQFEYILMGEYEIDNPTRFRFAGFRYSNPKSDIVVIELESHAVKKLPPPLVNFCGMGKRHKVEFVSHDARPHKRMEPANLIFPPDDIEVQKSAAWCKKNGFPPRGYEGLREGGKFRFQWAIRASSSGSPAVMVDQEDVYAVAVLTKGYPSFYLDVDEDQQEAIPTGLKVVEATSISDIYLDMKDQANLAELCDSIFGHSVTTQQS